MDIKRVFNKIDKVICNYFGIEQDITKPTSVNLINNELFVTSTLPYKRHAIKESWDSYSRFSVNKTNNRNLEKLGLATGKAIAKNLIVSFENPSIKRK